MEITLLGYILIPLGIFLILFKNKYLLLITLFFAPFTASSVLNIEYITFGLQPSYYFGSLFLLKELLIILKKMKITKVNSWLFSFIIFSIFSLIMLIIYYGDIVVWYAESGYYMLRPTIHNFTQLIYLIYCFFIYIFVKNFINRNENSDNLILQLINIQIYSLIFVCFFGLYQLISDHFGFPFLTIFSQREGVDIGSPYVANILKINSVAPEASMLSLYLTPMLGFVYVLFKKELKLKNYLLLVLIFLTGFFTISTSFLIGFIIFIILFCIENFFVNRSFLRIYFSKRKFLLISLSIILFIIFSIVFSYPVKVLLKTSFDKIQLNEWSGIDRLNQFFMGIRIFKESKFLGVGFGTIRTTDLFSTLLANVGLVGTLLFIGFIMKDLFALMKISKYSIIARAYLFYFVMYFGIAFLAVSEIFFLYMWGNLAIAEFIIEKCHKLKFQNLQLKV